ncbi:MAG: hypothetical protein GX254_04315 [Clostridiales bacterium]|jgi:YbbR domain-containing protein|nr:hypothetical protein [Clostridiales bacterium]
MIKKTITRIANSKIFYVVISIIISSLLWMYVINVENKEITKTVTGIPVEFVGKDDILADRGLLISEGGEQAVDITFYGRRNIVSKYDKSNIKVTVDLTDVRTPTVISRIYEVELPEGKLDKDVIITERYPQYISISLDKRMEKSIPVTAILKGSVAEGYIADDFVFNPSAVNVSGPEGIVSKISNAEVTLKRENLKETIVEELEYVLKDEKGSVISSDRIISDIQTVEVKLPILQVKDVALTVDVVPGGGAEEKNAKIVVDPGSISLAGDPDLLKGINRISLRTIDLAEISSTFIESIPIPVPNGVTNLSGELYANVSVEILGLVIKKLSSSNFEVINVPAGYTASIATQKPLEITIRGPADEVAQVGSHNIRIVCDLSDIEQVTGMKAFLPTVYVDGYENVGVIKNYSKLIISLSKDGG